MKKRAAIICAGGIGDGLLMMIASAHLKRQGFEVTTFHTKADLLAPLFPTHTLSTPTNTYSDFDLLFVQNDNSKEAWDLIRKRESGELPQARFFFPTPCKAQKPQDYLCNPKLPIATNLSLACAALFGGEPSKENEMKIPQGQHRLHKKRVLIHPTSADVKRNWLPQQYLKLAHKLKNLGFTVAFCASPDERPYWAHVEEEGFSLPIYNSLTELSQLIYESGYLIGNDSALGHLASALKIPTLTISGNPKRVRLWRPDWHKNQVATIPFPLPNFKGINIRMRDNHWQLFVSLRRVLKNFKRLTHAKETCSSPAS